MYMTTVNSLDIFCCVCVAQSLVFFVVFSRNLFVLLSCLFLVIVVSVLLRFMSSDYPFGIFKLKFNIFEEYGKLKKKILDTCIMSIYLIYVAILLRI